MTTTSIDELKKLTEEPAYTFVAIKNFTDNDKLDLLAFIMEKGSNYSENLNMMRQMAAEKNIPLNAEVLVININHDTITPQEVETMAQDIVDAIYDGEESDYEPVIMSLGDILE